MKPICLPFSEIPHTARLFTQFLSRTPQVQPFYPRSPRYPEWFAAAAAEVRYDPARRHPLASILERQNRSWKASPATLENISRLRAGAGAVVTGQQVALFGGPLFSMLKAVTAIRLAEDSTRAGVEAVPIFWLATDDHDLAEVEQVLIPSADGSLGLFRGPTRGAPNAPVSRVELAPDIGAVIEAAAAHLSPEVAALLRASYLPGKSLGWAFGRLFSELFGKWGIVVLDAGDPELHALSEPVLRAAIQRAQQLDAALLERGREIEAAGCAAQVKVTDSSTQVFAIDNGARTPIRRRPSESGFLIGDRRLTEAELLAELHSSPADFSPNVLLRPVVEDTLLPTIAYVGGAAEIAYFAQAEVLYQHLLGRVTPIVLRLSATLLDAKSQALLEKYNLRLTDVFAGEERLRERLAAQALPAELQASLERAAAAVRSSLAEVRQSLGQLDKTLVEAAGNAEAKMQHQLEQLRARAGRAELRQGEILSRHAEFLSRSLYPDKTLQERAIAGVYFLSRHGVGLLENLYRAVNPDCLDHQILAL